MHPKKKVYESKLELDFSQGIPNGGTLEKRKRYFIFIEDALKENLKETLTLVSGSFQRNIWRNEFSYENDFLKTFERTLTRSLRIEGKVHNEASFSFSQSDCVIFSLPYAVSDSSSRIKNQIVTTFRNIPLLFTYKDKLGRESVRFVEKLEHFDDYFVAKSDGVIRSYRYDRVTHLHFSKCSYGSWRTGDFDFSLYEIHMNLAIRGLKKETYLDLSLEEISVIKDYPLEERKNTLLFNYLTHENYWRY